jgi:ribulose-phosphate 3-epimerase
MKIAPSILTADFTKLSQEIDSIKNADLLHLDIMDGHFVPNMSFGPAIAKQISNLSKIPLDVHLMVTDPLFWVPKFAFPNTKYITIHVESNDVEKTILDIKKHNIGLGLCIKPKTEIKSILPYIKEAELILVMTVEPGFGGQSFMEDMMIKVKELIQIRENLGLKFLIEIDGGINQDSIKIARENHVDIVVVGSYLFNLKHREKEVEDLR